MTTTAREHLRRSLHDRLDAVADRVVRAVADEIPAYGEMGPTQLEETRAIARWAIGRLVDLWTSGGELTSHDLQRFRGIGVARANDGRPLFAVLRAYRVAAVETSDALIALGGEPTTGDELTMDDVVALGRVLLRSVDQLSEALFAGYTSGSQRLTTDRESALHRLLDDMVAGRQTSAATLRDRAEQLGLVVPARVALLLARSADGAVEPTDDQVDALVAAMTDATDDDTAMVLRRRTAGTVAVLAPSTGRAPSVSEALGRGQMRGCLVDGLAVADLPAIHRLATTALDHAPDEAFDGRWLLDRGDALVVGLLAGHPPAGPSDVAREVLGPLLRPENEHLLTGLSAYLRAGSSTVAAATLGLHPQSMRHRLRRIVQLTGRDPRRSWDRLLLDLARTGWIVNGSR